MFSFLRRANQATDEVKAAHRGTTMLSFDPSGIVRAISFHLLDEGNARALNLESSQAAVGKLTQRMTHLTISAAQWAAMENVQRLQWLLKQSRIVVKSTASRLAVLFVRR